MVNKVTLIGNLGADAEVKEKKGQQVANLRVATSKSWKDNDGNWKDSTTWHTVSVWGKPAEFAGKLKKGNTVYVEGEIQNGEYEKDGQKRFFSIVKAYGIKNLTPKNSTDGGSQTSGTSSSKGDDDDLPF